MISLLHYLLSRGFGKPLTVTSSDHATEHRKPQSPAGSAATTTADATQGRRELGGPLTQAARLTRQWALEAGLPTAEYVVAMHALAANLPHYVGGGRMENDR